MWFLDLLKWLWYILLYNQWKNNILFPITDKIKVLRKVFAKNERGYRHTATNNRFLSLLILLLSVASLRRKLLKKTCRELCSIRIEKVATYDLYCKRINSISNNLFLKRSVIDYFSTQYSWYFIILFIFSPLVNPL